MPQFLLELFSEEIPARMQAQAGRDLERLAGERLAAAELPFETIRSFAGPRRLTLVVDGLPAAQGDRSEERKGPRVGAPDAAIQGFLRSTGLAREALVERDGVYFAVIERAGRPTAEILAETVEAIVRGFPWPKSMTWGTGKLRWVRPLRRILAVFDRLVVPVSVDGIEASDLGEGHRFMGAAQPFRARDFDEYREALAGHFVVLDPEDRKARILDGARKVCAAQGLELVEDIGLLDEVAGLAEWPVPILGDMEPSFLDLPPEVIRTSMRTHQKYFAVRDPATGALAAHFLVVANVETSDGGKLVAAGNARVLSARLKDAQFFWEEDLKQPLEARLEKLKGVTFHAKLGTMFERVERIEALAREIAPLVGADPDVAARAARLAKADLGTGMVSEFPELQGIMGGYYARSEGLGDEIADAIRDHYKPQGPADSVPTAPLVASVALADKIDTLTSFFAIDERPTGSRDPYALRRAALGILSIIIEAGFRLDLLKLFQTAFFGAEIARLRLTKDDNNSDSKSAKIEYYQTCRRDFWRSNDGGTSFEIQFIPAEIVRGASNVLQFLVERLKVRLRDEGKRHDLVDAVFALGDDDLARIVARVEALDGFLHTEDGANLLAGYKRAVNILNAEAKKGGLSVGASVRMPGAPAEETALIEALAAALPAVDKALASEDFAGAMETLAGLRVPVDRFFDKVLVNSPVPEERDNRLRLLLEIHQAMARVADFSQVSG